ncbi:DUF3800 domain-containing protein [Sphingomonas sp.]|uniref:DUF3800 domain-containing protein n=1 Tax=Sphingomonas sp. TaxID=28214 RepID=UPI003752533B
MLAVRRELRRRLHPRIVSGLPTRLWSVKPLAFLQAFTEDSEGQTGERRLYLATYIMAADAWIKFSDEWDAILNSDPPISYFTMKEAHDPVGGQFRKFTKPQRDQKLAALAELIAKYRPFAFHTSISRKDCADFKIKAGFYPFQSPYFLLYFATIFGIAKCLPDWGLGNETCGFIFDESDGLPLRVMPVFDRTLSILPPEARARIDGVPDFRDDKKVKPLQAADFLAWHVRRAEEDAPYPAQYGSLWKTAINGPYGSHQETTITRDAIKSIAEFTASLEGLSAVNRKKGWIEVLPHLLGSSGQ